MKDTEIETGVLDAMERAHKRRTQLIVMLGGIEGALLLAFVLVMDFGNRLHWLILIGSLLTYGTLGAGLLVLGAHANVNTLRILQSLELLHERAATPSVEGPDGSAEDA